MPTTNGAAARNATVERTAAEAKPKDVGRAIARLDPADMAALGVGIGDTIAVGALSTAVCRAMPAFPDDRGNGTLRIDGLTRDNCGVAVGGKVTITPMPCAPAESVTLVPADAPLDGAALDHLGGLLDGVPVVAGAKVRALLFGTREIDLTATKTAPAGPVLITPETTIYVEEPKRTPAAGRPPAGRLGYEDIGGLGPQLARIREIIELPLRHPDIFARLGIDPPRGVLLHGPPGTGKTLIARTIAHEADANFFTISGPEVIQKHYGESEAAIRRVWNEATKAAPSIIFIDEIDSIAPKRDNVQGEVEKRVVAQLLALMDGLAKRAGVVVIAATNLPNAIDPALRRPGRFDREIEIPIPDRHARRHILQIHSRAMPLAEGDAAPDLDHLAAVTHGYVGADLESLCREAAMACLRGLIAQTDISAPAIPFDAVRRLRVTADHFRAAMSEVQPSAIREVFVEVPDVRWDDVGGLDAVKRRLIEAVEWPLRHAALFRDAGIRPPRGVLLAGPPGVGKTMIAKAVANESQANFISVKGPELLSKFVGESERALREVFTKARQAAPCVVFFDEIDALIPRRGDGDRGDQVGDRVLGQFLTELDGVEELAGVLVLAATNRRDRLDPAVLRPGRFDEIVELDLPDAEARRRIFEIHLRGRPLAADVDTERLASETAGVSGAQVAAVCRRAGLAAVRRVIEQGDTTPLQITAADLAAATDEELRQ